MAGRGAFWAITPAEAARLRAEAQEDEEVAAGFACELGGGQFVLPMDKAWNAIHRCLTEGTLDDDRGEYPLDRCVLGGELLCETEPADYLYLKTPDEVRDIAAALPGLGEGWFRERYAALSETDYPEWGMPVCEDDFQATWQFFCEMREFYRRVAEAGWVMLFSWGG